MPALAKLQQLFNQVQSHLDALFPLGPANTKHINRLNRRFERYFMPKFIEPHAHNLNSMSLSGKISYMYRILERASPFPAIYKGSEINDLEPVIAMTLLTTFFYQEQLNLQQYGMKKADPDCLNAIKRGELFGVAYCGLYCFAARNYMLEKGLNPYPIYLFSVDKKELDLEYADDDPENGHQMLLIGDLNKEHPYEMVVFDFWSRKMFQFKDWDANMPHSMRKANLYMNRAELYLFGDKQQRFPLATSIFNNDAKQAIKVLVKAFLDHCTKQLAPEYSDRVASKVYSAMLPKVCLSMLPAESKEEKKNNDKIEDNIRQFLFGERRVKQKREVIEKDSEKNTLVNRF